jgi:hypothetical protein
MLSLILSLSKDEAVTALTYPCLGFAAMCPVE